ncbi:MAG: argininosuccinate lyase [Armatimonadota bacterium]|nr:argininosuccinate lyase [Armatimonadota bacterium]MDR7519167.1 argininosuccinate lyase [Armatimonadota bacterium]MDR7550949.1 argininosuccinate lyase [Armatimonadota bacterium]
MSPSAEPSERYLMWGGRFTEEPDPRIAPLLSSLPVDRSLLRWDLLGSLAHLTSLASAGVVPADAAASLGRALRAMLAEAEAGTLVPDGDYEDVHSFIEATLAARLGPAAGWLHAGRSRNDQVVTAFRLALKDRIRRLVAGITELQAAITDRLGEAEGVLLPAYTHLQRAQPVLLAHHWLAYFWMLSRDAGRLRDAFLRLDVSPLGSGAIAGSGFPVDRAAQAAMLGFSQISENSVDATGDRDFVLEAVAAVVGLLIHLSRWAEELILWTTQEFGFIGLPDALVTGSSLMPQKRNPDLLELTRAQAGVGIGALTGLAAVLKGLPPGYNRDLQEDKAAAKTAFAAAETALAAMRLVVSRMVVHRERMAAALRGGFLTATEVADYLVRRGVPFREAHHLAGRVVQAAEAARCELWELPLEAYRRISPLFEADVLEAATPDGAVAAKDVPGGTAPGRVREAIAGARAALAVQRAWLDQVAADQRAAEARLLGAAPG